uniref:WAP four-disulfide core domain 2 n=1 Tax=Oryzias melastigma TaxID=30732 RepID=A0A3B3BCF5_ORYME
MSAIRTLVLVFGVFVPPYLTLPPKLGHCPSNYDGPASDSTCSWDNECPDGDKCCVFNNRAVCVPSVPIEKMCPLINEFGICVELCSFDDDCSSGQVCCSNGCGHVCKTPIIVKPGLCPDPRFTHQCGTRCQHDGQCSGEMKCCPTSCGQACRRPI